MATKQFISSYRGAASYLVNGVRYDVRTFAQDDGYYTGDGFEREIRPLVGCVRGYHHPEFFEFPPAEVMALFPGYQAAKFEPHTFRVIYQTGTAPFCRQTSWGAIEVAL